jgi:hypothetical protein
MKIVFLLRNGMVEWEVPESSLPFHFGTMATQVAMAGYFLSENLYIRHSELVGISMVSDGKPVIRKDLQ